jgi:ferredoxin
MFLPYGFELEVARGASLLAAADEAAELTPDDFFVGELCEGRHECGNCCVEITAGSEHLSPVTPGEVAILKDLGHGPTIRSACTARVLGDVTVRILTPVKHAPQPGEAQMQAHP